MTPNSAGLSPATIEAIAGLSAGAVATLVVHPLDIVKTRMQVHQSSAANTNTLNTFSLLGKMFKNNRPVVAMYRGITPNLIGNASSWAVFFYCKKRTEHALSRFKGTAKPLSPQDYFVSSTVAGVVTQVLTNPIWVLKVRMVSSDRTSAGAYPTMWSGAKEILKTEGWRAFYRGLGISLVGVSHGAVQFAVYDPIKRLYFARRNRSRGSEEQQASLDPPEAMTNKATVVISTIAKFVAGATTYPHQVIRSRLQNYDAAERYGVGVRGVAVRLWKEEGLRGFYRGIIPGIVRVMPATWVTFLVYENVKSYLPERKDMGG
ncbi:mitochondrial carrier domain-containing protein [Xylariomycetidae sp. FL2044]|nr:mitochondrial carrier domain-containing protein [Xylariomycetidae sp. FL2044]